MQNHDFVILTLLSVGVQTDMGELRDIYRKGLPAASSCDPRDKMDIPRTSYLISLLVQEKFLDTGSTATLVQSTLSYYSETKIPHLPLT